VLQVRDLSVVLSQGDRPVALSGPVSFDIDDGEIFGLVGESGSGKSMTGLALMRLQPSAATVGGAASLDGRDLVAASEAEMRELRGSALSMIFQEPTTALNPAFTLESQLVAVIRRHSDLNRKAAQVRAVELLQMVGIPDPVTRVKEYPHQLSGGMCQRVMIAMALAAGAKFLIADEPTTALDVTIQEQILQLIERLSAESGLSVLFISHDLGVVARLCRRVAVLYCGEVVETGFAEELLRAPVHPYTQGLVRCAPDLSEVGVVHRGIPGMPPHAGAWPTGCRFRARCPFAADECAQPQVLRPLASGRMVRCCRAELVQSEAA
jgi:oligopeptide/dipeptide ABC transporter ATP-binding protein